MPTKMDICIAKRTLLSKKNLAELNKFSKIKWRKFFPCKKCMTE